MEEEKKGFRSVEEYIAGFPEDVRERLEAMRATIKAAAPGATEKISYQMPAFVLNGNLVYYAAWKKHIGFYPGSGSSTERLKDELAGYETEKGSIKFPLSEPLPLELVSRIVQFRVAENMEKAAAKGDRKKA